MIIKNEDVGELIIEVPEGHTHLRATLALRNGSELVFQEATIANLVRAYISVKTHPTTERVSLKGKALGERKAGYAEWQLIENESEADGEL